MDNSPHTSLKVEQAELVECDMNDNYQQLLFDIELKVEKDVETDGDADWCVNFESCGDLLEPMYFKEITEAQELRCPFCFTYFSDTSAILKHNLTHLQVTIVNPTLFQCDCCDAYFTEKHLVKRHILTNNRNVSKTKGLSYKPKAFNSTLAAEMDSGCMPGNLLDETKKGRILAEINDYNQEDMTNLTNGQVKLKDGMTNSLPYKPRTYKASLNKVSETVSNDMAKKKNFQCKICLKMYTYRNWHAHMQAVHGDGGYFCEFCNREFKCERYVVRHVKKRHEGAKPPRGAEKKVIKCDHCDAALHSLYALTTHKRTVHSDDKHVCYICNSKFKCRSYLLTHMRRVHYNDGKMHECECGKSFKSPRYLRVHKKNAHSK